MKRISKPRVMSTESPKYQWSAKEGKPVLVGKRDDQEFVQSNEDTTLKRILDQMLPEEKEVTFPVVCGNVTDEKDLFKNFRVFDMEGQPDVADQAQSDLELLQKIAQTADELREAYSLPTGWTIGRVFGEVQKRAQDIVNGRGGIKNGQDSGVDRTDSSAVGQSVGNGDRSGFNDSNRPQNFKKEAGENIEKGGAKE